MLHAERTEMLCKKILDKADSYEISLSATQWDGIGEDILTTLKEHGTPIQFPDALLDSPAVCLRFNAIQYTVSAIIVVELSTVFLFKSTTNNHYESYLEFSKLAELWKYMDKFPNIKKLTGI